MRGGDHPRSRVAPPIYICTVECRVGRDVLALERITPGARTASGGAYIDPVCSRSREVHAIGVIARRRGGGEGARYAYLSPRLYMYEGPARCIWTGPSVGELHN